MTDIHTITTPEAINTAQRLLGRQPGVDSFALRRYAGAHRFTAGQWVEAFAHLQVPVAGPQEWLLTSHDVQPSDHVYSWLSTSPADCHAIAGRGQELQATYWDRIHEPEDVRPKEVTKFVAALDSLTLIVHPLFDAVTAVEYGDTTPNEPDAVAKVEKIIHGRPYFHGYAHIDEKAWAFRVKDQIPLLQALGIIELGLRPQDQERAYYQTLARYTHYITGLQIKLQEVKPSVSPKEITESWVDKWYHIQRLCEAAMA